MAKTRRAPDAATPDRQTDLLERLGAIGLYLLTDMDHHSIADVWAWGRSA